MLCWILEVPKTVSRKPDAFKLTETSGPSKTRGTRVATRKSTEASRRKERRMKAQGKDSWRSSETHGTGGG